LRGHLFLNYENDKATFEWLNSQKKTTCETYKWSWKKMLEIVNMTGDEILEDRANDTTYQWEKRVYDIKVKMEKEMSSSAAKNVGIAARSFFRYHRTPLEYRRQEKKRLNEATVQTEDYRFSIEDIRKMDAVADLTEKYVLRTGISIGLRDGDFSKLTRGDLEPYVDREPPVSIGKLNTGKENVPAFLFLTPDAIEVIKLKLKAMSAKGKTSPDKRIITFKKHSKTSQIVRDLVSRAGIVTGNKRVRFHCLRKFLIDRLSAFMSESKWKQIVGKKISESAYVSVELLRERYVVAAKEFQIVKTGKEDMLFAAQVEAMLATAAEKYGWSNERKAQIRRKMLMCKAKTPEEVDEAFTELTAEDMEKIRKGDCTDGEHCTKVVAESELPALFAAGWRFVATLPSGACVVTNDP
jgi:integrase